VEERFSGEALHEEITLCDEVFHTASGVAFADFITDGHRSAAD
jgi:hypothetical protein